MNVEVELPNMRLLVKEKFKRMIERDEFDKIR